ncbi:hypothetical protein [Streptomyces sp. NPDC056600]|uniref:hypothetical protein n=1 Tax=Streptomyces sp. NPDC056600 TaxID=3345874 RepID=UPI0036CCDBAC
MSDYGQLPPERHGYDRDLRQTTPRHVPAEPAHLTDPPAPAPAPVVRPRGDGTGQLRAALVIHTIADIAAAFLGLWIVLYLFDANQGNVFVDFVKDAADGLAWWSQDIFSMDAEVFRTFLNFALPAGVYLLVGHGAAAWLRRF